MNSILTANKSLKSALSRTKPLFIKKQLNNVNRMSTQTEKRLLEQEHSGNISRLADAYRIHGHRAADIDPLRKKSSEISGGRCPPELELKKYGLDENSTANFSNILYGGGHDNKKLKDGVEFLKRAYCHKIGYEFMYIEDEEERNWFAQRIEELSQEEFSNDLRLKIGLEMAKSQNFDLFLATKFGSVKRYGGEGSESLMAFFIQLFDSSCSLGIDHIVLGMAHRGRLNTLTGPLQFPPIKIFQKIMGLPEFPTSAHASGDVLSHLSTSVDLDVNGKNIHFTMLPNSSHLEAVNPMAVGKTRGKQKSLKDYDYSPNKNDKNSRVLCLQIHGDGALVGQGVNQETLAFAYVPHFDIGGSVHVVINNQIGFTTGQERGRSCSYATDIGKIISAPVIHVNGDSPEDVVRGTKLALDYRTKFRKDVFIDLMCYRKWGHNELDDPTFTNPLLYSIINSRKSTPDAYCEELIKEKVLDPELLKSCIKDHTESLLDNMKRASVTPPSQIYLKNQWKGIKQGGEEITIWDTGVDTNLLQYIGIKSVQYPDNFNIHPHLLKTFIAPRKAKMSSQVDIDWATAETLAIGSLLYQGFGVRVCGEDVGRGTFSQRHAELVDQKNGTYYKPLNSISSDFEVVNSILSEEAVLAFEYGFSLESPNNLAIWEAQFGDFFNGAQIIFDTMITSGETKWMMESGIVVILPHGMDGAGPEHSSCRMERFLQLSDSNEENKIDGDYNNIQIVNPTTSAQYFHALRRQMIRDFRKPLIVVAPKKLLRLSAAHSTLNEMGPKTYFKSILGDSEINVNEVNRVVFVSGQHYYKLKSKREELKLKDVALVRIESLCPFPTQDIQNEISKYKNAKHFIWCQEEHQNMGAWTFVKPRFENLVGIRLKYIGRGPLAAPAVGIAQRHLKEDEKIINDLFNI